MNTKPKHMTPRAWETVEVLREHGPLSSRDVATKIGLTHSRAVDHLRVARRFGHARPTAEGGSLSLWHVPEHKRQAAKMIAAKREAARIRKNTRRRLERLKDPLPPVADVDTVDAYPMIRRIVPAIGAMPLEVRAPASVFHLGAML